MATTTVPNSKPARLPTTARFEFQNVIGEGGMGTVYRALDRRTGQFVAIKVLKEKLSVNPTLHQRLVREFKAASELEHPNIVRAISFEMDGEISYLVYELVEGVSLGERIETHGRIAEADAVRIITQVAQALHYAHQRQVVHRDVKPDNILLLADGRVKLTDFGLAKDFGDADGPVLTRPAHALGTPHFMAPEQFADAKSAGPLCDVYSLGATLYQIITGVLPFNAKTALAILTYKEAKKLKAPRVLVPGINERVEAAILASLDPDPTRRPASCLEFFKMLTSRRKVRENIVNTPAPPPSVVCAESNRRAAVRYPLKVGSCAAVDSNVHTGEGGAESWPLVVRDVSELGMGLLLARRFELGTVLTVELSTGSDDPPTHLPVTVVRVTRERGGHWIHGCTFPNPLPPLELSLLLKFA